jgi:hypothetical protein
MVFGVYEAVHMEFAKVHDKDDPGSQKRNQDISEE